MNKPFDCLKFKWEQQAIIYEAIKDLSPQAKIEYFRQSVANGPFAAWLETLKQSKTPGIEKL